MPIPEPLVPNPKPRILILAAHPDDEVVACAAALGRAQKQGAEVFVLYLTHGCVARETLWPWQRRHYDSFVARRHSEAEQAARYLGITPLNWPARPARHLWRDLLSVHAEIRTAIAAHQIDQLWAPAYEGGNADHDALNAVASVLALKGKAPPPLGGGSENLELQSNSLVFAGGGSSLNVLEFAEYNFFNNKPHSNEFPFPNNTEQTLTLTPEEQTKKRAALSIYASEKQNLNYVYVEREIYRPIAAYDYNKPPHPGTPWYARFQWVPFPHPRVDFTRPEEVSAAIKEFFSKIP